MPMSRVLRIVLGEDDGDACQDLRQILSRLGHQVIEAGDGRQLAEVARVWQPDLLITEMDGIAAAVAANREREVPVILVTGCHGPEVLERAVASNVLAYLVKPVKPADLEAAIGVALARFEEHRQDRQEVAALRQALEDRKVVERAKGTLMKRLRLDEQEAFRRLQQRSGDGNGRLVEVARAVLAAEEVFRRLDDA
jgi:two-component system, response regulator PdtaR